jgi:hypothetical protein
MGRMSFKQALKERLGALLGAAEDPDEELD